MVMAQWIEEMAKGQSFANVLPGDMGTIEQPDVAHFHNRPGMVQLCKGPITHAVPPVSIAASTELSYNTILHPTIGASASEVLSF